MPNYKLSENQQRFVDDAYAKGLEVDFGYSGRGMMFGRCCPAVVVDGPAVFSTEANTCHDNMGKDIVIYAKI